MMSKICLETDCLPIHIESDDGCEVATNYEMWKRRKVTIDEGKTTSSIDHQKIKFGSASSLCDYCANFAERFGFLHEGHLATLSAQHIHRLRKHNTEKLLLRRKLLLVINLDHTFVNHISVSRLTPEEAENIKTPADSQDVFTVRVPPKLEPIIIKFRPSLRNFLKEASEFFEIYAYANAHQSLVWKIVELLDPRNEYFGRRVISPEHFYSTHKGKKSLDLVLGEKTAALVVDDELDGWKRRSWKNIIIVEKYCFFKKSGKKKKRKSLCELKSDEPADCLATLLDHLKQTHNRFFNDEVMCDNLFDRNVGMLLKMEFDSFRNNKLQLWRMALANCICKRLVAPLNYQQMKMAEKSSQAMCVEEQVDDLLSLEVAEKQSPGATCVHDLSSLEVAEKQSPGATCVHDLSSSEVAEAANVGKSPARWCHLSWIDKSIRLWQKRHVDKFPVMTRDSEFTCSSCGCSSYMNTPEPLCRSLLRQSHEDKLLRMKKLGKRKETPRQVNLVV